MNDQSIQDAVTDDAEREQPADVEPAAPESDSAPAEEALEARVEVDEETSETTDVETELSLPAEEEEGWLKATVP